MSPDTSHAERSLTSEGPATAAMTSRTISVAIVGSRGFPSRYGGFETFVRNLAPHLRRAGIDVTVYCRGPGLRTTVEEVEGIRCVRTMGIDRRASSTLSFGFTASLDTIRRRPDVVLLLNVANGFYLPMLRRAAIPTAVNVDGIEWERAKWNAAGKAVFRSGALITARYADSIVVDSEAIGAIWESRFGVKTTFIPYGATLRTDQRSDKLAALGIRPGGYALAVARLVPENNVELFLEAMSLHSSSRPIVIVGSASGPSRLEDELRQRAATEPDFHWLGHVADDELLAQLWTHCGVYFHGHSVGGTNPALLQALACGSPALAIDTPFNREVIPHAAHLCRPVASELAARIDAVFNDDTLRRAMSTRGRAVVADRYQWDAVCDRYAQLLRSLVKPARAGGA